MELVRTEPTSDLDNFIDFLFDGIEGYAYLVARVPFKDDPENWNQEFFEWPAQREFLLSTIRRVNKTYEVYIAPVLYQSNANARRENVKVSNVVWTEFDGNAPDWSDPSKIKGGIGEPSYRIQSGLPQHEHVYWKMSSPLNSADEIEFITERITHNFEADSSAWDATQVLRPPTTVNHKRGGLVTQVLASSEISYDNSVFNVLDDPPPRLEINWQLGELPDLQSVLLKYALGPNIQRLLKLSREEVKDRSASLMNLAYECCEAGMTDNEVFVVIRSIDAKWKKFADRIDRDKRLAQIVTIARAKNPLQASEETEESVSSQFIFPMKYGDILSAEVEIDWVMENFLMERGSLLLTGPSGVGKTQFLLEVMKHMALGKDFLHYKVPEPKKITFLSLEMSLPEVQVFLRAQDTILEPDERALLHENFTAFPVGEAWSLNTAPGQELLLHWLDQIPTDGLFVDSLGSTILGSLTSQETVQVYLNFVDRLRNRLGLFYGAIHHNRKKVHGQTHSTQDDTYGDQYLVARASTVYSMLFGKNGTIRYVNMKQRMAEKEKPMTLIRTDGLHFKVSETTEPEENDKPEPTSTKSIGGFEL